MSRRVRGFTASAYGAASCRYRARVSEQPDQPEVRPLDVDGVAAVAVGTAVWAVLAVAALLLRDRLAAAGHDWWLWVCVAGVGLGLLGLPLVIRRSRAYRAAGDDEDG